MFCTRVEVSYRLRGREAYDEVRVPSGCVVFVTTIHEPATHLGIGARL
jgi:hypothetical protein